jgi:excinuclease ABC subunit C
LALDSFVSKSEVVSHTISNVDVFSITSDEKMAYINYLHVSNGSVNQSFTIEYKKKLQETDEELLQLGIVELRERFQSDAKEIIVPVELDVELENVTFTIPQRGDKKTLLELSVMNGKQYKFDRLKQAEKLNPEQKQTRLMKELQEKLHLPTLPYHIECFDNSNISGSDAVAACVVFKGMKPSKKDYKRFNIKTVVGPDDYASMKEVVSRRYNRLLQEQLPMPDLIVADGGKGQMEIIRQVIQDELNLDIPIAGLAKDDRHRTNELLYGFPPMSVQLKTDSELFHVLTQLQDEVHRFAIEFHRNKRSKRALESELDNIPGVGEKTRDALLKGLKSVKLIRESSQEKIAEITGPAKAKIIYEHFHP